MKRLKAKSIVVLLGFSRGSMVETESRDQLTLLVLDYSLDEGWFVVKRINGAGSERRETRVASNV